MVSCAACGCSKTPRNKIANVTFHSFPKYGHRREIWSTFLKKPGWIPKRTSVLCSRHFDNQCFDRSSQLIVRLHSNAIPTIEVKRFKYGRTFSTVHEVSADAPLENFDKPVCLSVDNVGLLVDMPAENVPATEYTRELKLEHTIAICEPIKPELDFFKEEPIDESMLNEESLIEYVKEGNGLGVYIKQDNLEEEVAGLLTHDIFDSILILTRELESKTVHTNDRIQQKWLQIYGYPATLVVAIYI